MLTFWSHLGVGGTSLETSGDTARRQQQGPTGPPSSAPRGPPINVPRGPPSSTPHQPATSAPPGACPVSQTEPGTTDTGTPTVSKVGNESSHASMFSPKNVSWFLRNYRLSNKTRIPRGVLSLRQVSALVLCGREPNAPRVSASLQYNFNYRLLFNNHIFILSFIITQSDSI